MCSMARPSVSIGYCRIAGGNLVLSYLCTASKLELYVYLDRALVKQARLHAELSKPLLDINTITKAA